MLSLVTWTMVAGLALTGSAPPSTDAPLDSSRRHVRTTNRTMAALLREGYHHSPTFAALMRRLDQSDVYVYVEETRLPPTVEGRLVVLQQAHDFRYIRIQIALRGGRNDWIAVLGHELRHAVEVADDPGVRDMTSLVALYRRIGIDRGNNEYDTVEAQETGRRVFKELVA